MWTKCETMKKAFNMMRIAMSSVGIEHEQDINKFNK